MIEFVIEAGGGEGGRIEALGTALGLSATFRRVLVIGEFGESELRPLLELGAWGAFVISPCAPSLDCFRDLGAAVAASEASQRPVGYEGDLPQPRIFRVSTFNKHYLKQKRWIIKNNYYNYNYFKYIPLFSCLYNLIKLRYDVPVVVSDVYLPPRGEERADYQVLPTLYMPQSASDVVDIYAPPLPASSIAKGILMGGYKAGPVIAVSNKPSPDLAELGGYVVDLSAGGDVCRLFEDRVVGYDPEMFKGSYSVASELCDMCGDCFKAECSALRIGAGGVPEITGDCVGCGACALLCTRGAIKRISDVYKIYIR
ncbi:MAG: 4Fe-4S ferredoxin [Thermoproteus sp.]|nr:4Fe-4S ferredoxin [Thermoproteus sp.]